MVCDSERRNPPNWRLYHLLELEPPVTAKQVQWTFRKVTLRHHFYQAYIILYDSERKSLYDALGEDAVGFIHSGNWGPLIHMLGARKVIEFYFIAMILLFALLIIFFIFLGIRVDNIINWSWLRVIAPLFALTILMVIVTAAAAVVSFFWKTPWEEGMRLIDRIPAIGNFISALCYTIFAFLIANEVDNSVTNRSNNITGYFILPIIADGIYYLSSLVWRWPRRIRLQMEVNMNKPSFPLSYGFFVLGIIYIGVSIAQWVLIGQKIDQKINSSWYVVFIPFCVKAFLRMVEAFMRSMVKRTIGIKSKMGVAFDTIGAFFFNGMLLVSLYFVGVRIVRGKSVVTMPRALIPVYVALGYMFLGMIFTFIYLMRRQTENERNERLNNLKWTPTEPQTGERGVGSGPMLFRDFGSDADWDAIDDDDDDDDNSSAVFHDKLSDASRDYNNNNNNHHHHHNNIMINSEEEEDEEDTEDYADFESDEEEELLPPPRTTPPYGASAPLDEDPQPYTSGLGGGRGDTSEPEREYKEMGEVGERETETETLASDGTERPGVVGVRGQPPHLYHDPYEPKTDAAPQARWQDSAITPTSSLTDEDENDEDEDEHFEEDDEYEEDEDDRVGTDMSSSASSSALFTSSVDTPR